MTVKNGTSTAGNTLLDDMIGVQIQGSFKSTPCRFTDVKMTIQVEMKKTVWGMTGMIESAIEQETRDSMDVWIKRIDDNVQDWQNELQVQRQLAPELEEEGMEQIMEEGDEEQQQEQQLPEVFMPDEDEDERKTFYSTTTGRQESEFFDAKSHITRQTSVSRRSRHTHLTDDEVGHFKPVNLSKLLDKSYSLAEMKRHVSDTRSLVAKTELRIKNMEQEMQDRQLEVAIDQYMQRANQLFQQQQKEQAVLTAQAEQLAKYMSMVSDVQEVKRGMGRSKFLYWMSGFMSSLIVVVPLTIYLYRIFKHNSKS